MFSSICKHVCKKEAEQGDAMDFTAPKLKPGEALKKVCIMGSGNWGSAIAKIVGDNVAAQPGLFDQTVKMWVFDEQVMCPKIGQDRSLVDIINETHENVKYLPGIKLPHTVVADANPRSSAHGADIFIWVVPHQFVTRTVAAMIDEVKPSAISVSLIKGGLDLKANKLQLCSDVLKNVLGHDVSVLMGANVANDVAAGQFCEATLGYGPGSFKNALLLRAAFHCKTFRVTPIQDIPGVELCGGLKNVVALAAGFCDGLGFGSNTKAAIMRVGLDEMKLFIRYFHPEAKDQTFMESCGVADLITTCFSGRNRKCAEAFARAGGSRAWADIEAELLNGQKLQGTLTAEEIWPVMQHHTLCARLPLLTATCQIALEGRPVASLVDFEDVRSMQKLAFVEAVLPEERGSRVLGA
mmetsp:Transcript_136850/g.272933  ORF Transcript_136850/g.272933 Transcript_136850/m.272933 type:complete len:410 (+) Transcript_136850:99-1328(+)